MSADQDPIIRDEEEDRQYAQESFEDDEDYEYPTDNPATSQPQNLPDSLPENPIDQMSMVKNMTTEQLNEMLAKIRKEGNLQPQDSTTQDEMVKDLEEEGTERIEEQHPNGERLIDPVPETKELDMKMGRILMQIAEYRTKPIESETEYEEAADLFLELNTILLEPEGKQIFELHKGLELMMILYRKQRNLRSFIIKSLNFALEQRAKLCSKFIEMSGLPVLFSFFMRKDSQKKKKKAYVYKQDQDEIEEDEQSCISLISNLLRITKGVEFDRVFYKFKENKFEKIDRLIELHKYYTNKVRTTPEEEEDDGYFTLQIIDFVIIFLINLKDFDIEDHFKLLLEMHGINKIDIQKVSMAYTKTFGLEEKGQSDAMNQQQEDQFRSVSVNPSESESEETIGNKRIKLDEHTLNTDNLK
ncbi:unnamed protein product [Moneuplotes crassus]|uniref:Beta-catenin-like protein 1 N-terminal domain-containing protein n=1 Tax=Euplotes crassus TaxID=5936 RepID=A0AAD1US07_EUPCR|nr:unnamed protein product [Moneuplotes crassus]